MLQFYLGPSGSGKSNNLYNHIIEESIKNPELLYYIIVPEQSNLQTQQKLVKMHPQGGIINIDVLSFNRLAHRIFEETGYGLDGGRIIDDCGKNLVLRRVSQLNKKELNMLGENLNRLGYITSVKSVISEFMQYGINVDKSKELALLSSEANNEKLALKLRDVSLLYEKFLSFIKDKYTTREELLERLSKVIPYSRKIKKSIVVFDGFTGFTPVQLKVIRELLIHSKDIIVALNYDTRVSQEDLTLKEHELFYLSKHTIKTLGKMADQEMIKQKDPVTINADNSVRFNNDELRHLEKNLFREKTEEFKGDNNNITVFKALNPDEEMETVAALVKELVSKEGYKYSDIAIITGDIETYRSSAERALSLSKIPYFTDKTQPLLLNPMIEYLRAFISILSDNYSYESVFRLLRSGLTDISQRDIDEFENYIVAMGIKGRKKYNTPFSALPSAYSNIDADKKAEYLLKINEIRLKISQLANSVEAKISDKYNAGSKASVRQIALALYDMLVINGIPQKMSSKAEEFQKSNEPERAKTYSLVYEKVMNVFEQLVELLGDERLSVAEFGQLLESGFDEIRIGIIPAGNDYVQVGDLTRSRVGDIKALFLVGANDGLIPQGSDGGGLLSDEDRDFLTMAVPDTVLAPTKRENAYTQRLYLYMMLSQPSDKLFISYSRVNASGESLRCSYLIRVLERMFKSGLYNQEDYGSLRAITDKESAFKRLALMYSGYLNNTISEEDKLYYELLSEYFSAHEDYRERFLKILSTADNSMGNISKAAAEALYGNKLYSSITRLETYAECAYQYFLRYGLKLKDREVFDFAARDLGSAFHASLEKYTNLLKERNLSFTDISSADAKKVMDEAVEYVIASEGMASLYSNNRMTYMVNRIKRIMARTADILSYQASKGEFAPHAVETDFAAMSDLEALNIKINDDASVRLYGRIDRIDTCTENDTTYVRVIDYKSGDTDLNIDAVKEGRALQLVIYMATALEMLAKSTGNRTIPAGVLYYHIDDPMVKLSDIGDASNIEEAIRKKLKMKGYINSDKHIVTLNDADFEKVSDIIPVAYKKDGNFTSTSKVLSTKEFDELIDSARLAAAHLGERIVEGDIKTAFETGDIKRYPDTCRYCDYQSVCRQKSNELIDSDEEG